MKDIDVILVRYCPGGIHNDMWEYTLSVLEQQPVRVLTRDNSEDNIGLVKARLELLDKSTAPVIVLMDFDFKKIEIDFQALAGRLDVHGIGMTIPCSHIVHNKDEGPSWSKYCSALPTCRHEWEPVKRIPCNCMIMKRLVFNQVNGIYPDYHTSHADSELCRQLWKRNYRIEQHNLSHVIHYGGSAESNPEKMKIWEGDRKIFESRRRLYQ
jgi:hypothetical protein